MKHKRFKTTRDISPSLKYERITLDRDQSQMKPWPRRLLYVPSMTSYERRSGNKYNGTKEPEYNAISYTWGRFEDDSEPPININGVTWRIPGIRKLHFTASEFQKVIETVANNCQFIWLDIACIDQENDVIKMDEVNKQGAIFERAQRVYSWMVPWTTSEMLTALHTVETFAESLGFNPEGLCKLEPLGLPIAADLDSVSTILQNIAQQAWFTSLWTLQEAFLRRPTFLSKSSDLIYYRSFFDGQYQESKFPVGISWLAGHCRLVWDELRSSSDPRALSISQSITDSGLLCLYFMMEPYLLYPAALKRYVTLPQDAVYAIMNVFELRMPVMRDTNDLLLALSIFLNQKNTVSYQIFLHQEPVSHSDAWRMSKSTHLPFQFFNPAGTRSFCTIEPYLRRRPKFTGKMTTLDEMAVYWATVQQQRVGSSKIPYRPNVFLDATLSSRCVCLELENDPPAADDPDVGKQDDRYTKKMLLRDLATAFPFPLQSYRVLLLGQRHFSPLNSKPSAVCYLQYDIGLIVRQGEIGENKPWYRAGFSSWLTWSQKGPPYTQTLGNPDQISVPYSDWHETQCLIG